MTLTSGPCRKIKIELILKYQQIFLNVFIKIQENFEVKNFEFFMTWSKKKLLPTLCGAMKEHLQSARCSRGQFTNGTQSAKPTEVTPRITTTRNKITIILT